MTNCMAIINIIISLYAMTRSYMLSGEKNQTLHVENIKLPCVKVILIDNKPAFSEE